MNLEEVNQLLASAQSGNEEAKNKLVTAMLDDGCMKRLSRYLYLNRLLEPDEVKQEFWFGVAQAIPKARPIGNPLRFLSKCGVWQVVNVLRQRITSNVTFACVDCGKRGSLRQRAKIAVCSRCTSPNIITTTNVVYLEELTQEPSYEVEWEDEILIREFRDRLSPKESEVFDLMINGFTSEDPNYLRGIATQLEVSAPRIAAILKKIRYKLKSYLEE